MLQTSTSSILGNAYLISGDVYLHYGLVWLNIAKASININGWEMTQVFLSTYLIYIWLLALLQPAILKPFTIPECFHKQR
jgi:hypothetical protein